MAISIGLNTRQRTAVATATGLPSYARNDTVGTHESPPRFVGVACSATTRAFIIQKRHGVVNEFDTSFGVAV